MEIKSLIFDKNITSRRISIQSFIKKGIPQIKILGISPQKSSDMAIKLQTIFLSNQIELPYENIQINITPNGIDYQNYLDLSLFVCLFQSLYPSLGLDTFDFENTLFLGELNLFGEVICDESYKKIILAAKEINFETMVLSRRCSSFLYPIKDVRFYLIETIKDLKNKTWEIYEPEAPKVFFFQNETKSSKIQLPKALFEIMPIIAGKHSVFLIEKTKIHKWEFLYAFSRLISTLHPTEWEQLHSNENFQDQLPIAIINSNITKNELIGSKKSILESLLFRNQFGILLIDDFPSFSKDKVLIFKDLLEKKFIDYPSENFRLRNSFWLTFFSYPCPCGNFLHPVDECICSYKEIKKYHSKFELYIKNFVDIIMPVDHEVISITMDEFTQYKEKIKSAMLIQFERYQKESFFYNSHAPNERMEEFMSFDSEQTSKLWKEKTKMLSSENEKNIIRRIARTIADYNGNPRITADDLQVAFSFRNTLLFLEQPKIQKTITDPSK